MPLGEIPRTECLWRSVYKPDQIKKDGTLKPAFFRDKRGLSCDLAKLSTVDASRLGHAVPPMWPITSGLARFTVANVRDVGADSDVVHEPLGATPSSRENYAHCQLTKWLTTEEATQLARVAKVDPVPRF